MENALYDFLFTRWAVSENSWIKIVRAHFPWSNLYIVIIQAFSVSSRMSLVSLNEVIFCKDT